MAMATISVTLMTVIHHHRHVHIQRHRHRQRSRVLAVVLMITIAMTVLNLIFMCCHRHTSSSWLGNGRRRALGEPQAGMQLLSDALPLGHGSGVRSGETIVGRAKVRPRHRWVSFDPQLLGRRHLAIGKHGRGIRLDDTSPRD